MNQSLSVRGLGMLQMILEFTPGIPQRRANYAPNTQVWNKIISKPPKWFFEWANKIYNPIFIRHKHPRPKGLGTTHVWQRWEDIKEGRGVWYLAKFNFEKLDAYHANRQWGDHRCSAYGGVADMWNFGPYQLTYYHG